MKKILLAFLAIFLIIEEWLWDGLTTLGHLLISWLKLEALEKWLSQTSPTLALMAFSIPLLIVTPINLAAFSLLAQGFVLQGLLVEILAKLLGTLLVARVFALTKPQLLTFAWLRITYTTITGWLQWAHQKVTETGVYRWSTIVKAEAKIRLAAWFN
jgi:hypothetical protein